MTNWMKLLAASTALITASLGAEATARPRAAPAAPAPQPARQPNILVIVADDLGFSDLGAFGGEIRTPNLDAIAHEGLRLTGFHTAPTCSPTRSMMLSGTDNHLAGHGSMAELLAPNQRGQPGYEGHLPNDVATLADRLRGLGYATLMSGKWHLGTTADQQPARRGFDRSFDLAQGGGNHFGKDIASSPTARGTTYWQDGQQLASLPAGFYSSDAYADHLIEFLKAGDTGRPFFGYLTFTAPHWPLQVPDEDLDRYKGRYAAGFEALRQQRLARLKSLGLVPPDTSAHDPLFKPGLSWRELTGEEQARQVRAMEIYAAMVERMDRSVGRVIAHLKATGQYDNTIILFTSDNGAEGTDLARSENPEFKARVSAADNRLENFGKATSYIGYGPGWAQAATAPSFLYKGLTTEGGTRVAAFIRWPGAARTGISNVYGNVMDVLPTLVEAAGGEWRGASHGGRAVRAVRGTSWKPYLDGRAERVHGPEEAIGSELFGRRALRQGDWKLVDLGQGWQLFNIATDPGETRDLAGQEPGRVKALVAAWDQYSKETGVVMPSTAPRFP
ncbi:arylsulfatase [Sphingomonas sp. CCH5-D11]|uniref:arylsulfatase n=1 Tax=Sphingomonas sp. CCH5-D11 TaxID=1768786 RepID=UPI000A97D27F